MNLFHVLTSQQIRFNGVAKQINQIREAAFHRSSIMIGLFTEEKYRH